MNISRYRTLDPVLWKLNLEDALGLSILFLVGICRLCLVFGMPMPSWVFVLFPSFLTCCSQFFWHLLCVLLLVFLGVLYSVDDLQSLKCIIAPDYPLRKMGEENSLLQTKLLYNVKGELWLSNGTHIWVMIGGCHREPISGWKRCGSLLL
jgi:hypothetical protein